MTTQTATTIATALRQYAQGLLSADELWHAVADALHQAGQSATH